MPKLLSDLQGEEDKFNELEKLLLSKLDFTGQDIYLSMKVEAQKMAIIQGRIEYRIKELRD